MAEHHEPKSICAKNSDIKTPQTERGQDINHQSERDSRKISAHTQLPFRFVEQATREKWLAWREGKIGASDIPILMGLSPFSKRVDLLMQKSGHASRPKPNYAMEFGTAWEPVVLELLRKQTGRNLRPKTLQSLLVPWLVAQVDGFCDGFLVEIKCPFSRKLFSEAQAGKIPDHYVAQMQAQMFVSGAESCLFSVFYKRELVNLECFADRELQRVIVESSLQFLEDWLRVGPKSVRQQNILERYLPVARKLFELLKAFRPDSLTQSLQSYLCSIQEYQQTLSEWIESEYLSDLPPQPEFSTPKEE